MVYVDDKTLASLLRRASAMTYTVQPLGEDYVIVHARRGVVLRGAFGWVSDVCDALNGGEGGNTSEASYVASAIREGRSVT